jgi:hypothetical protein
MSQQRSCVVSRSGIGEKHHETEIHVVLLVAVKERSAWVIGRELDFGLLIG